MKLTSIGLIPEDWDAISLSKVGVFGKGSGVTRANAQSGNIPCIRYGEIYTSHNDYIKTFYSHISPEIASTATKLKKGDVLFAGSGETKEEIGKAVAFLGDEDAYAGGDIIILSPNMESSSMYLGYVLNSKSAVAQKASMGQGDAVVHIHAKELADVVIPWPKVEEQERIADALSSMDALISGLDEAIEKKRQIKEGLMQNLLTGSIRLRGFSGEWHERRLDSFEMVNGTMLKSSDYQNGAIPVIAGGKTPAGYHSVANRPSNTITISGSGAYAGFVSFHNHPIFASDCSTINNPRNADVKYLYFCLLSKQEEIYKCQAGGAQPHVHAKDIKDITIQMPDSFDEQKEIAKILTNAEEEILRIELLRDKYSLIKQGMMQELLTGKTRL